MRKIKEVLRLKFDNQLSKRQIAQICCIAHSTVSDYLRRFREAALSWPLSEKIDDNQLEQLLFPRPQIGSPHRRPKPDWTYVHQELRRKGVTLMLLWQEYKEVHPAGSSLSICGVEKSHRQCRLSYRGCPPLLQCAVHTHQKKDRRTPYGHHR